MTDIGVFVRGSQQTVGHIEIVLSTLLSSMLSLVIAGASAYMFPIDFGRTTGPLRLSGARSETPSKIRKVCSLCVERA